MLDASVHKLQRISIDLDLLGGSSSLRVRDELVPFISQQVLPQMEHLFDTISQGNESICLQKVVIDLGDINFSNWQQSFCHKLLEGLQKSLVKTALAGASEENISYTDSIPNSEILFKKYLFFLTQGRLPWWGDKKEASLLRGLPQHFDREQWRELVDLIKRDHHAVKRMVNLSEVQYLEQLLAVNYQLMRVHELVAFLAPMNKNHPLYPSWRCYCWIALLQIVVVNAQSPRYARHTLQQLWLVREALKRLLFGLGADKDSQSRTRNQSSLILQDLATSAKAKGIHSKSDNELASELKQIATLPSPWRNWLGEIEGLLDHSWHLLEKNPARFIQRLLSDANIGQLIHIIKPKTSAAQHLVLEDSTAEKFRAEKSNNAEHKLGKERQLETAINVSGTGVVIIHPFLKEFFTRQNLLCDNDFCDEQCRSMAVHMLAYLSFGDSKVEEFELLLVKLLCAMPWEVTLMDTTLSLEQKTACDDLLLAILTHWQALKSQSPQWLREQFFWRPGKLKDLDTGWKLSIEARAQDVLLGKLPWGTGVIKLPWMEKILHVNWDA